MKRKSLIGIIAIIFATTLFSCHHPHDEVFSTYPSGAKKLVFTVIDVNSKQKIRVGEKLYYENGELTYEKHFKDDRPTGTWYFYHENGKLFAKGNFDKNDSIGSDWQFTNENGKPYLEEAFDSLVLLEMTADKRPLSIAYHKGDVEYRFQFNNNFTINAKGKVVDGKREGKWEYYYANGQKMLEAVYSDGVENGTYNSYRENGVPYFIGYYINGIRAGVWEVYDEAGNLAGRQDFDKH